MSETAEQLLEMLQALERRKKIYRAEYYEPYPYQQKFHTAEGYLTPGKLAIFRALCAANGIGKTMCGCMEDSYHATGKYPDWWKGHVFDEPVSILVCGETNESVRDILQKELFGDPTDPKTLGTGTIPIDCIGKINKKPGINNAFDSVKVRHVTGRWSTIFFRAYEQGWPRFQGTRFEIFHADEEPPVEIWGQLIRAVISKRKAIGHLTFTPERGLTGVVDQFMNQPSEGQALINAAWEDAPHLIKDGKMTEQARILAANLPAHQREMRMKGIPVSGEGIVFDVPDDQIKVKPFEIPKHWPQIRCMDFGWNHPFAAARLAYDRDADCIYVCNEYRESKALPAVHVQAMDSWGKWSPVAWPHDGVNGEKSTGDELVKAYRDNGLNCLPKKATNPPEVGKEEGSGGNSVETSIMEMLIRMETGRLKVFSTCTIFFEEKRTYHRKNGLLVKLKDDVISAVRYGVMMIRHARIDKPKSIGHTATTHNGVAYLTARPTRQRR